MGKHDKGNDTTLRKQAELERTRMIKLRHNEDYSPEEAERDSAGKRPSIILPILFIACVGLIASRFINFKMNSIPKNALSPTMVAPPEAQPGQPAPPAYVETLQKQYALERAATDEEVKRMLTEMNGKDTGPRPVSSVQTGQTLTFGGAQTPEMVQVQGQWFKKNEENIYRVNGENIYHEDRRRERR
jgi:hypothetical protein